MSVPHRSIATMDGIEFINLSPLDISPLISKCDIKVLYLNENRNSSYIDKEAATEMGKTLRGCPIVGYYKGEDFKGHGDRVVMDDDGVHFECDTRPYGFVPTDAKVWFSKFDEVDDFGNNVTREYLMTTGYLWTGQFEEAQQVLDDNGKPQSMELTDVDGHWAKNSNTGMEFFIINDAVISKLCILGDQIQPCFEGASVTAPEISNTFSLDDNFKKTLFGMFKQLEFALQGGQTVDNEVKEVEMAQQEESAPAAAPVAEEFSESQDNSVETEQNENQENIEVKDSSEEFEKKDTEEKAEGEEDSDNSETDDKEDDDEKKPASKNSLHTDEEYSALESQLNDLTQKFSALEDENKKLIEYKNSIEDEKKDELINKFYMLDDADKKEVIENKRQFSLEEIEAKLAVICYRKKISFEEPQEKKEDSSVTFNLDEANSNEGLSDWVKEVKAIQDNF